MASSLHSVHVVALAMWVLGSEQVHAAEAPAAAEAPVAEVAERFMYLKFGFGEGTDGISVNQHGQELRMGYFGGNMAQYFKDSPAALAAAQSYRTRRIVGVTLATTGLAALVAGLVYTGANAATVEDPVFKGNRGVALGLMGGGLLTEIIGAIVVSSSTSKLFEAVNIHNAELLNEHLSPGKRINLDLFVGRHQASVGLSYPL